MPQHIRNSQYWTYRQNNSGGKWELNDNLGHYVIIEAFDREDSIKRAEHIGIEFGIGCSCCGDRWDTPWSNDSGKEEPTIYGEPVQEFVDKNQFDSWYKSFKIVLHPIDSTPVWYKPTPPKTEELPPERKFNIIS